MPTQSPTLVRGTHISALVFGQAALPLESEEPPAGVTSMAMESAGDSAFDLAQPYVTAGVRAFYDTGEHAWSAEGLYPDQLLVGNPPVVPLSYGDIIAMGDLYCSVEQMMNAPVGELAGLKKLIRSNLAFYKDKAKGRVQKDDPRDVSNEKWDEATHERYRRLAEDNYEHFSPLLLLDDPKLYSAPRKWGCPQPAGLRGRDHRSMWELHHARAIGKAQELLKAPGGKAGIPMEALVINAFGDHFLTDAFASGHLLNKGEIIAYFKSKFYRHPEWLPTFARPMIVLTDAAERFFAQVADLAWKRGDVAKEFSKLQFAPIALFTGRLWGLDIDRPSRLADVLITAAREKPDRIANLAVKTLHDILNKAEEIVVQVENDAGDGRWPLRGDGFLVDPTVKSEKTLDIMKRAVAQSAANITDRSILASDLDISRYQAKVWKHVPRLTAESRADLRKLVTSLIDPGSARLLDKAADYLKDNLPMLTGVLKEDGLLESQEPYIVEQVRKAAEARRASGTVPAAP